VTDTIFHAIRGNAEERWHYFSMTRSDGRPEAVCGRIFEHDPTWFMNTHTIDQPPRPFCEKCAAQTGLANHASSATCDHSFRNGATCGLPYKHSGEHVEVRGWHEQYDPVNHPKHYVELNPEPIAVIEGWSLNYHLGNALKYIARAGKKDGADRVEDLRKSAWYLNREIENRTVTCTCASDNCKIHKTPNLDDCQECDDLLR
jgi:uncharacterized protein DUF3310